VDETPKTDAALPPTRVVALIRRVARPIWVRIGIVATLEMSGRRTGKPLRVSVIPVKLDGATYVMAFGGATDWALNLRAAGGGELRRRGRTTAFTAIECEGDERDRVIAAYLTRARGPIRKDFDRRPNAADHPTFRLQQVA
jgi:deazaflavin-dependent oxidoreductase (nitroreductase family)